MEACRTDAIERVRDTPVVSCMHYYVNKQHCT